MKTELIKEINHILKDFPNFWDGEILYHSMVIQAINQKEPKLIKALINNEKIKSIYSTIIDGLIIFDFDKLISFLKCKEYWQDSFTRYRNYIGLTVNGKYLDYNTDVVLDFPFKDCVLEGGMTKEDQGKDEIYYNEVIDRDKINHLFSPKLFTNTKRYSANGVEENITEFHDDNLIIKGNNLIVLHSLKERYAGKIKLIYIDPPYNPRNKNNTFVYNNRFNHSTWLTFMKNRITIAKELLHEDGAFIIAIDKNEVHYLGVLINELFPGYESHCITIVHNPRGVQGKNFSYTHEYAFFIIPQGKKIIGKRKIEKENIEWRGFRDHGGESERKDAKNCFYGIIINKEIEEIVGFTDVCDDNFHPNCNIHKENFIEIYPVDKNGVERKWRYARQSVNNVKHLLRIKNIKGIYNVQIGKDFGSYKTVWIDPRYDSNEYGTKIVNGLVENNTFSFPKSLWNVYDCIYSIVGNDKNAIILDYHAGSGTTAHAVLKLNKEDNGNRKFIMIEQMDYIETITRTRLQKVLETENINDGFIYTELMRLNQVYVDKIQQAKDNNALKALFKQMKREAYLNCQVDLNRVLNNLHEKDGENHKVYFEDLSLDEQKRLLIEILDKNQLYVNASEMDDEILSISEKDKLFTKSFYRNR